MPDALSQFQDHLLARRVTRRFLAGLFEAPPAMHAEILEWAVAVVAANASLKHKEALQKTLEDDPAYKGTTEGLEYAKEFQKKPTWKVYKLVHERAWFLGGNPGQRKSIRQFQKMTPEKQQVLQELADYYVTGFEKSLEGVKRHHKENQKDHRQELARIKKYMKSGVKPLDGSVTKQFPINVKGWKYGEDEIQRRLDVLAAEHWESVREMIEVHSEDLDDDDVGQDIKDKAKKRIEKLKAKFKDSDFLWNEIQVEVTTKNIPGAKAQWVRSDRRILVTLPYAMEPWQLDDLAETLRHELQHFGQSYLAYTIGHVPWDQHKRPFTPGFPSRKVQTPDYRQHLSPKHPDYDPNNPEVRQLRRKLRDQGIDPREVDFHALDDIEFYTRLSDDVAQFQSNVTYAIRDGKSHKKNYGGDDVPLDLNMAIKFFTGAEKMPYRLDRDYDERLAPYGGAEKMTHFGVSEFFRALKSHAPGKWRKAVSEFVKAVT